MKNLEYTTQYNTYPGLLSGERAGGRAGMGRLTDKTNYRKDTLK